MQLPPFLMLRHTSLPARFLLFIIEPPSSVPAFVRGQLRLLFRPSHQALFALLIIQTLHPVANGRLMTATQAGVDKCGWERYLCLGGARGRELSGV